MVGLLLIFFLLNFVLVNVCVCVCVYVCMCVVGGFVFVVVVVVVLFFHGNATTTTTTGTATTTLKFNHSFFFIPVEENGLVCPCPSTQAVYLNSTEQKVEWLLCRRRIQPTRKKIF